MQPPAGSYPTWPCQPWLVAVFAFIMAWILLFVSLRTWLLLEARAAWGQVGTQPRVWHMLHQSAFNKYFPGQFINDRVSRDTSFPETGVKWERRHDNRADWRGQDRSRSCTAHGHLLCPWREEVRLPAESRGDRNLVGPLRKVVKVWNSCCREQKWSRWETLEGPAKEGARKFIMEPSNMNMQFSPERLSRPELGIDNIMLVSIYPCLLYARIHAIWLRCPFSIPHNKACV